MDKTIATAALILSDGTLIEQVSGDRLILWHDGETTLGSTIDYAGQSYIAAALSESLTRQLHFPDGIEDFGTPDSLISEIADLIKPYVEQEEDSFLSSVAFTGSWFPEALPGLIINPWGPLGSELEFLALASCLCRRALWLTEHSIKTLAALPHGLNPTLIFNHPTEAASGRLLTASGARFLSRGEVIHLQFPMIVCTSQPLRPPAVSIPLRPAVHASRRMTSPEIQALVQRFQPRLLHYRFKNHGNTANCEFDVFEFSPEVRVVARTLGAVIEGSQGLQSKVVTALSILNDKIKAEHSQTVPAVVLEVLLGLCHSSASRVYVGDVTELANELLENRCEKMQLPSRLVGDVLREKLGLIARRGAAGFELCLDIATARRVHRLSNYHGVLQRIPNCPRCQEVETAAPATN